MNFKNLFFVTTILFASIATESSAANEKSVAPINANI